MPTIVRSPEIASVVRLLIEYSDALTVEMWLDRILDLENGHQARMLLFDVNEHTNKTDFLVWIKARDEEFRESF